MSNEPFLKELQSQDLLHAQFVHSSVEENVKANICMEIFSVQLYSSFDMKKGGILQNMNIFHNDYLRGRALRWSGSLPP